MPIRNGNRILVCMMHAACICNARRNSTSCQINFACSLYVPCFETEVSFCSIGTLPIACDVAATYGDFIRRLPSFKVQLDGELLLLSLARQCIEAFHVTNTSSGTPNACF